MSNGSLREADEMCWLLTLTEPVSLTSAELLQAARSASAVRWVRDVAR